jgi:hemerythrin
MDTQHEELAALLNELYHCYLAQGSADDAVSILDRVIAHTIRHFASEDRLMHDHGYPLIAAHEEEHGNLLQQISVFRGELASGQRGLSSASMLFLKQWLLNHVLNSDRKLGDFLAHSVAESP